MVFWIEEQKKGILTHKEAAWEKEGHLMLHSRALREAEFLRLREHKNVVSFYKYWDEPGRVYGKESNVAYPSSSQNLTSSGGYICIVMEYMAGGSMKDLLRNRIAYEEKAEAEEWDSDLCA